MMENKIKRVDEKLKTILREYGIIDEQKQREIIIKIINAFTGRWFYWIMKMNLIPA